MNNDIGVFVETVYQCTLGRRALASMKTPIPVVRYHLLCHTTDNVKFNAVCTNPAVIETAINQYLENEGPMDDEPLNEYTYASFLYKHGYLQKLLPIFTTFFNTVFIILDQHA